MKKKIFYTLLSLLIVIASVLIVSCDNSDEQSSPPIETRETLKVPRNINIDKRIVTWNAVENASGYVVDFNGTETISESTSFDLHFHTEGGKYYVKVKAVGDGTNYLDSEWSAVFDFALRERAETGFDGRFRYTLLEDGSGYELTKAEKEGNNLNGKVTIPDYFGDYPVKRIGDCAFTLKGFVAVIQNPQFFNTVTTGVKLPTHLESIGKGAFSGMAKLTEIVIPDTVTDIGSQAFACCESLTRVVLPKNLKVIPDGCFQNTALSEIVFPEALEEIGLKAFECQYHENINRTVHITSKLSSIVVPSSVKSIGDRAFYGRENLEYITLPDTVEEFGQDAFRETKWYNEHPDGMMLLGIGECFLYEYRGEIPNGGVIDALPSNVKGICPYAFKDTNLTKIVIPNGVRLVGEWVFAFAESLSEVILPSDWETIRTFTFQGTLSLKTIIIPANIKTIESSAFASSGLERIVIPESITVIDRLTFSRCENLSEVILPQTLTRIEKNAFYGTKSLKVITLPESLTYIGEGAFSHSGIEKITVPKNVKTIEDNGFSSCKSLTEINLPEGLTSIGNYAFHNCSALKEIILPASLSSIGNDAFRNCSALKEIILPASLSSIGSPIIGARVVMFKGCEALTHIYYEGNRAKWEEITKDVDISDASLVYTYAAEKPETPGKYWHYVDSKATAWTCEE